MVFDCKISESLYFKTLTWDALQSGWWSQLFHYKTHISTSTVGRHKVEIFNPTGAPKGSGNGKNARNPTELVDGLSFITQKQATFSYVDGFWSYIWGWQQHLEHMG